MRRKKGLPHAIDVVQKLRDPKGGCPWDLKQTHESLLPFLLEESYEFIAAVEKQDPEEMKDELGDVLLQVLLHARIAEQKGLFNLDDVAENLAQKLIYRHPHVFGNISNKITPEQVLKNWQELKQAKKKKPHAIDEDLLKFPALYSAHKIGKKSNDLAFDWSNAEEVLLKVEEELQELKIELKKKKGPQKAAKIKEELGDLLFSLAQLARHLDLGAEETLRAANKKFVKRFQKLNDLIKKADANADLQHMKLEEKEAWWAKVKKLEKKTNKSKFSQKN